MLTGNDITVTPEQAWLHGTNLRKAEKKAPEVVRAWLASQVARLVQFMDMNKTINTDEELQFCCRTIIRDHPTLKLEEIVACFDMIKAGKFGKMFERLKAPEILCYLRDYEGTVRADIMENRREMDKHHERTMRQLPWAKALQNFMPEEDDDTEPARIKEGVGQRLKKRIG